MRFFLIARLGYFQLSNFPNEEVSLELVCPELRQFPEEFVFFSGCSMYLILLLPRHQMTGFFPEWISLSQTLVYV